MSHSNYIVHRLRLPPKSKIGTYSKLFLAFLISGIIHCAGDYGYLEKFSGGAILYFLLHACAITIEDGVIGLAKRAGLRNHLVCETLIFFSIS